MEFGGSDASLDTGNIRQPLQLPNQEPLPRCILQSQTVDRTASNNIKVCLCSLAPNPRIKEYLPFQFLEMHVTHLVINNANNNQNLSLPPRARQPLPRRIGNQLIQPRFDRPLPSLPSQALPYMTLTSKKRSRSDMDGIILERTVFKKPRIASSLGDIAEHLSVRLSRIDMNDKRVARY